MKETVRLFKKKFKSNYIPVNEFNNEDEKSMLEEIIYNEGRWIEHICVSPQLGHPISNTEVNPERSRQKDLQKQFKFMSLMVVSHNYHQTIKNNLRARGIDCEIEICYTGYTLKAANNSAILFHNLPFSELLNVVSYNKTF